jgi:hypothetical protein
LLGRSKRNEITVFGQNCLLILSIGNVGNAGEYLSNEFKHYIEVLAQVLFNNVGLSTIKHLFLEHRAYVLQKH